MRVARCPVYSRRPFLRPRADAAMHWPPHAHARTRSLRDRLRPRPHAHAYTVDTLQPGYSAQACKTAAPTGAARGSPRGDQPAAPTVAPEPLGDLPETTRMSIYVK